MSKHDTRHWRSLDQLARTPRYLDALEREFPPDAAELEVAAVSRRRFLGLMGASTALAGATLTGCVRKPREKILPYSKRPEDLVPGNPRYYATAACIAGQVEGLLVESQEGRPTKIEGNPEHPMSRGATSARAQAEVLSLYDPERSRKPLRRGKAATWEQWDSFAQQRLNRLAGAGGKGLALLIGHRPSPTFSATLRRLLKRFPEARLYLDDVDAAPNTRAGVALAGGEGRPALLHLDRARVVLCLDADPLGSEGDTVSNARQFAAGRAVENPKDEMNRLYVVEPSFTVTGTMADHRLRLRSSEVTGFLGALAAALYARGLPQVSGDEELLTKLKRHDPKPFGKWPAAVAADLLANRGRGAIVVGEGQPPAVHALALLLNQALGNLSIRGPVTLTYDPDEDTSPLLARAQPLERLAAELGQGKIDTLVVLGGNPAYTAPADLGLPGLLKKPAEVIHAGLHVDETAKLASWHLPASHFLEAWGDWRAADGTVSIQQPLIAPLFGTRSELELLAQLARTKTRRGYELVREHWRSRATPDVTVNFDDDWQRWLHDGVAHGMGGIPPTAPGNWSAVAEAWPPAPAKGDGLELTFRLCPKLYDGRYANNGWLQELPDPVTKLTWDNAACLGPATASRLGVASFDMVELSCEGRSLKLPAFVVPGVADDAVLVSLGYGRREGGTVLKKSGFDVNRLRSSRAPWFARGASVKKLGRRYLLASTQDHGSMEGRPLVLDATLKQFREKPDFAKHAVKHPPLKSIWKEHSYADGHQWGMSIDLNACTGCNACVVACQSENNIPVVGKRRVLEGREMQWIRLDRYFAGPPEDPEAMLVQPMTCHHCELAPCEGVCPVGATIHSPEGLNDMAYNRCIGTRYCLNNCPYKVRRFNFFQYGKGFDPVERMQKNPDVTVRFRGVMEKCTFCVQRINQAKIAAKRDGDGTVPDGAITPACAQACPSQAIVFGNINDRQSRVAKRKALSRDYTVLVELNIKPRLTYLAKLRNPNPELA